MPRTWIYHSFAVRIGLTLPAGASGASITAINRTFGLDREGQLRQVSTANPATMQACEIKRKLLQAEPAVDRTPNSTENNNRRFTISLIKFVFRTAGRPLLISAGLEEAVNASSFAYVTVKKGVRS